jgi:hypothetical protein
MFSKLGHAIIAPVVLMLVAVLFDAEVSKAKSEKRLLAKVLYSVHF